MAHLHSRDALPLYFLSFCVDGWVNWKWTPAQTAGDSNCWISQMILKGRGTDVCACSDETRVTSETRQNNAITPCDVRERSVHPPDIAGDPTRTARLGKTTQLENSNDTWCPSLHGHANYRMKVTLYILWLGLSPKMAVISAPGSGLGQGRLRTTGEAVRCIWSRDRAIEREYYNIVCLSLYTSWE